MKLYNHQKETVKFLLNTPQAFITSTCGTGKTISVLETWHRRHEGKMLVIAPKSTLEAVWGNDTNNFYPKTKCGVFNRKYAKQVNYISRLLTENDIVVINIEATNLILENMDLINEYKTLVVDEFTSIKNRTAQRSKSVARLSSHFTYRYLLSGTPTPNGILDIWHPSFILDGGQRLGANFFGFRNAVCQPVTKGYMQQFTEWEEIPGAADVVGSTLKDITIRHVLEEVTDMPERIYRTLDITMPDKLRKAYNEMAARCVLELSTQDEITAVNKAVLGNKLLQIASGSVYDDNQTGKLIDTGKYELIAELAKEREHSLIVFIWQHQCTAMEAQLHREGVHYAVIDGNVSAKDRSTIIKDYQAGKYQTLLIQPAAAAHGITLTRSTATIWCSPTWNLEHFIQMNHRDYRIGQNKRSEVIMVEYKDTIENRVYASLQDKKTNLDNLLEILQT